MAPIYLTIMDKFRCSILNLLFLMGMFFPDNLLASVEYDQQIPQLEFAARKTIK